MESRISQMHELAVDMLVHVRRTPGAQDGDIVTAEDALPYDPASVVMSCLDRLAEYRYRVPDRLFHRIVDLCEGSVYLEEDYRFFVRVQDELRSAA